MYHHQIPNQYNSQGTEEPTVTLGNQYEGQGGRPGGANSRKENLYGTGHGEQHPQNVRLQYEREIQICHSEIEVLKEQIEMDEKEKAALQETIIDLKRQRTVTHSENNKLFQENQKDRHLIQNLKIDNRSMEMEIDKFRSERKVYYSNLNNIEGLRREVAAQIAEKNGTIDQLSNSLRKIERHHSECRLKMEDYQRIVSQSEVQKEELRQELKNTLEKYLSHANVLNKLEYELRQAHDLNRGMAEKIGSLEKKNKEMYLKLGYEINSSRENQSQESMASTYPINQRSMVEIKSYMGEIGNVLQLKKEDMGHYKKGYQKLRRSILALEQSL